MTVRVLHVVPPDLHPGTRQQVLLSTTEFDRTHFDSHVCAMDGPTRWSAALQECRVPLYRVRPRSPVNLSFWRNLWQAVRRTDADIIHLWNGTSHLGVWSLARGMNKPLVVSHERQSEPLPQWQRWAIRRLANASTTLVADSTRDDGVDVDQVLAVGVDTRDYLGERISDGAKRLLRGSFGIDQAAHLIGVAGRFCPDEGLKDAIWTADLLKVIRDDVHLLVLGDGPQRWRLERFVAQTHTADRVHFVNDYRPVELLPHLTCFWRTNVAAANPTIAAMAAVRGLPIVATDLPQHREFVEDGVSGFLFKPGNRAILARKTQLLLEDASLRRALGQAGRDSVCRRFPRSAYLDGLTDVYRRCVR